MVHALFALTDAILADSFILFLLLPKILNFSLLVYDELLFISEVWVREHKMLNNVFDLIGIIILKLSLHQR